jgi:DNA-binding beta-propeller fold protein YncE
LSQRGHSFGFSFASKGEGEGKLVRPAGVAVNEASGDVYVVDAGNNRIERFGPKGEFISVWGWGVSDGKAEYEVCTRGCRAGIAGEGEAQLDSPQAIAIDNSTSPEDPSREDVYVLSDTVAQNNVIEKFTAEGEPTGKLQMKNEKSGALGGVAVDSGGKVWVSDQGTSPTEIVSFNDAKTNEMLTGAIHPEVECEAPELAVDARGETFYVAHQLENTEEECPEAATSAKAPAVIARLGASGEVQSQALDYEDSSAVAVDLASGKTSPLGEAGKGAVYVDNLTSIVVFGADGSFIQRLGSAEQLTQGSGVAVSS